MVNRIGGVDKFDKQSRKRPDMATNIIIVPVSMLFYHMTNYKIIYRTLNSLSTNNMLSTTTADVHGTLADTIEK